MKLFGVTVTWRHVDPDTGQEEYRTNDLEVHADSEAEALRQLDKEYLALWGNPITEEMEIYIEEIEAGNW